MDDNPFIPVKRTFVSEKVIEENRAKKQGAAATSMNRRLVESVLNKTLVEQGTTESEYDPRTLYERLKEQRDKKEEEFQERMKFGMSRE